jgi:hypothetical protein
MFGNVMGNTLHAWSPRIILGPLSSVRYPSSVIGVSIIVLDMATDVLLDRLFNPLKSLASSKSQPASGLRMPGFGKTSATDCKKVQAMPSVNRTTMLHRHRLGVLSAVFKDGVKMCMTKLARCPGNLRTNLSRRA